MKVEQDYNQKARFKVLMFLFFLITIFYIFWISTGMDGAIMNAIFFLLVIIAHNTIRG